MAEGVQKEWRIFALALPLQIAVALSLLVGTLYGGYYYAPDGALPVPKSGELSVKMQYTFRCFAFPASFLLVAISLAGRQRHKVGAINPLSGNEAAMLLSKKRLTNTLEQTLIYVMLVLYLTTLLEREEMKYIFLYTMLFTIARVLFWVGYGIHPAYREAGTLTSFVGIGITLTIAIYLMCSRGFILSPVVSMVSAAATQIVMLLYASHIL